MNQPSNAAPGADPAAPRVAIVSTAWHRDIVASSVRSVREEFERCGVPRELLRQFEVPGAFEIPLHAKRLALSGQFDAVIACALVADDGVYRHEFVTAAVLDGLMRVQLDTDLPVFSCVLTPHQFHQHEEHQRFFREHFIKKGTEVARACLETLASLKALLT